MNGRTRTKWLTIGLTAAALAGSLIATQLTGCSDHKVASRDEWTFDQSVGKPLQSQGDAPDAVAALPSTRYTAESGEVVADPATTDYRRLFRRSSGGRDRARDWRDEGAAPAARNVVEHRVTSDPSDDSDIATTVAPQDLPLRTRKDFESLPGCLPAPGEELWIIERPRPRPGDVEGPVHDDEFPGSGALVCVPPGETEQVAVPLAHTDVKAAITGYIASVNVTQRYENPWATKIEAVYVFPLPANAAVSDFIMTVGDRRIRGVIREREQAQRMYLDARNQGKVASLLTQERPNVFTQRVANIEPGKRIDVDITYFHTVPCIDGYYEWALPMVVGPRFNPPGTKNPIAPGDATRVTGFGTQRATGVKYLRPSQRSGHDVSVAVEIDAGAPIEEIACRSHDVRVTRPSKREATVTLAAHDSIPNRDLVLRYRVAGDAVRTAMFTERVSGSSGVSGGYFTLMIQPPARLESLARRPLEMIFVLDCSGSMNGAPLAKAKGAIRRAINRLDERDTFQIVRFSESASQMGPEPVLATRENVRRGLAHLESLTSEGGTVMLEGIRAALAFPHDDARLRFVCFMTDGYIGNEDEILTETHRLLGDARVFSFGVGQSVNRFLLDSLAKAGRGGATYVTLDDDGAGAMDAFMERIAHPALTDIEIDWGDAYVSEVYPRSIPDLFVGRPVVITGRYEGDAPEGVRISGRVPGDASADGRWRRATMAVDADRAAKRRDGVSKVWARMKIADLADRATRRPTSDIAGQVLATALQHSLMSPYTAFLAVDAASRTSGDSGVTVGVPVPVPEGVSYTTSGAR